MLFINDLLNKEQYIEVKNLLASAGKIGSGLNQEVYAVGGLLRDFLLGKNVNDIDLMTVGDGIRFAKELAHSIGINRVVSFNKFGTALIPNKPFQIEVATARGEKYDANSRKPSKIVYTNVEEDLSRRDFTINAMAMDIYSKDFGKLYDPFKGIEDLKNKCLRTPLDPDETFSDDPLRMMRAAYFASKLGFRIEKDCLHSMKRQSKRIEIVSAERITEEFIKILSTPKPSIGLKILQNTGLMEIVFPEIHTMHGMNQSTEWHHKDIFAHTLKVVDNSAKLSEKMELRFAALVHDIAKPNTRRIDEKKGYTFHGHDVVGEKMINKVANRMRLSNKLSAYLKKMTRLHLRPIALVKSEVTDSAVRRLMVAAEDDLNDLMLLCRADITTKNPKRVKKYLSNFELVEKKMKNVMEKDTLKAFQSPIKGKEIMNICGIKEGPMVGHIKKSIEDAILDGKIDNNYESAKNLLNKIKSNFT